MKKIFYLLISIIVLGLFSVEVYKVKITMAVGETIIESSTSSLRIKPAIMFFISNLFSSEKNLKWRDLNNGLKLESDFGDDKFSLDSFGGLKS